MSYKQKPWMLMHRLQSLFLAIGLMLTCQHSIEALSSLAKNDIFPVFTTNDPHSFLLTREKLYYLDQDWAEDKGCHLSLSISPFAQNANEGKTIDGKPTPREEMMGDPDGDPVVTELGDLAGRTSMIALLYGQAPAGKILPPTLVRAQQNIFINNNITDFNENSLFIDRQEEFGFFSFPLRYRKRGVRFDVEAMFVCDFGIKIQTSVSSIRQIVQETNNLTTNLTVDMFPENAPSDCQITKEDVDKYLMDALRDIAKEIDLDICNFVETSIEELRLSLFWRHVFEVNRDRDRDNWPHALIIPFLQGSASVSPGKKKDPSKLFGVFFGNNDHTAVGFTAGLDIDFLGTIELGGQVGYTHFFDRSFKDFRIPNSCFQTNIFPFTTDVRIKPGSNWHFAGKIAAYHFLGMLSMYFQYVMVEHKEDSIKLIGTDDTSVFKPDVLEKRTSFKTKLVNLGFNYDISPNVALGFLWQAPLSQRNTYRSTTIMFGFNATF